MGEPKEVTQLLIKWSHGDSSALDQLMPLVYEKLQRQAYYYMSKWRDSHTLQPTALVNEVFINLVDMENLDFQCRAQFFGLAKKLMRNILIDYARGQMAIRRGGDQKKINVDDIDLPAKDVDCTDLKEALQKLEKVYPEEREIVELRYIGLENEEIANLLDISTKTVTRRWKFARAWLKRELGGREEQND
jgi:RNA polymerase sigma factor (TIGR02999 family)